MAPPSGAGLRSADPRAGHSQGARVWCRSSHSLAGQVADSW